MWLAPGYKDCIPPGLPRALLASRNGAGRAVGWEKVLRLKSRLQCSGHLISSMWNFGSCSLSTVGPRLQVGW